MKKSGQILVSSAARYIASVLCEHLLNAGYQVTAMDNPMYGERSLFHLCATPRFEFICGGGRANSVSVLEAITRFEDLIGRKMHVDYVEQNRIGDHICYISKLRRLKTDYSDWDITRSLDDIFDELAHRVHVREEA